jgi:hypothetical protein
VYYFKGEEAGDGTVKKGVESCLDWLVVNDALGSFGEHISQHATGDEHDEMIHFILFIWS